MLTTPEGWRCSLPRRVGDAHLARGFAMQTPAAPVNGVACAQGARGARAGSNPAARISGTLALRSVDGWRGRPI